MDIAIVLPICNERENLRPMLAEIERALEPTGMSFEVIAVDDGSDDGSGELLRELASEKPYLRVIRFRQNYGQSAAFDAGFRTATASLIVTMDADLQNDPADIPRMVELLQNEHLDFVAGNRGDRKDALVNRRLPSRIANGLIRLVTGTKLRDLGCSLKLYRREMVSELRLYGEMHRFIGVLVEGLGARTAEITVNHRPRRAGTSKYGLTRTFKVLLDLLTVWFMRGYQTKPIYIFGGIGLLLGALSSVLLVIVAWQKFVNHIFVHLQPLFTIAMIFSVMAVQFLGMGLLAEIMVRTYFESRQKPSYLIGERIGFGAAEKSVEVKVSPWVRESAVKQGT
jgi:glycosyltransferase involved in cell wall biosynthesis